MKSPQLFTVEQVDGETQYEPGKKKKSHKRWKNSMIHSSTIDRKGDITPSEKGTPFKEKCVTSPLEERHDTTRSRKKKQKKCWVKKKKNVTSEPNTREEIVKIDVGSAAHNRRTFEVRKALLRSSVKYFNEIFNGHPMYKPLRLLHMEPTSFALFLEWIQCGKYAPFKIEDGLVAFMSRIILYGLAEEFGLPQLKDYTMTVLISNYTKYDELTLTEKDANLVYMDTKHGSKLRSFISLSLAISLIATKDSLLRLNKIAWMKLSGHPELWKDVWNWMNRIKAEYLMRVPGQNQKVPTSSLRSLASSKCSFHVHPEGVACAFMGDIF
ncbi:hypothetical protein OCU04_007454 [Sclerotinia nivalis]|uniref:BTB domain-containing protein n=1 Tax=Sclerotinia nivalis TaxID=352851 RepID=A0A9X0DIF1_9HELO|nr:hypothetical protein OCU04_007454 [Sclerotinia nivalis]